jgi:hypothetical protein
MAQKGSFANGSDDDDDDEFSNDYIQLNFGSRAKTNIILPCRLLGYDIVW